MKIYNEAEFWFVTGSQCLYGEETLREVERHAVEITRSINQSSIIPAAIIYKPVVKAPEEISRLIKDANYSDKCMGIITWMHTFSPSKMWIGGLGMLQKPMLHLHTQFNREIPEEIDMDFMNTNQSAHGDREHGFITARMRIPHKIAVGYYKDQDVLEKIASWMRCAIGIAESRDLKAVRFGDNMREVAVTEGDKVETQIKLGWSVNTYGVGALVEKVQNVSQNTVDELFHAYENEYSIASNNIESIKYQLRLEIAMETFFEENGFKAFTTTFEDLYGLNQLPGMACQALMKKGYGFGGEGDWKTACLLRIIKRMAEGRFQGSSFMEDYTYHLTQGNEMILGAHMLEVCPSIAAGEVKVAVEPLGIGGKDAPARLVFEGKEGRAICVSLIDMGGRMRMIAADVECVKPVLQMKNLPVARVMWKPLPNLKVSAEAWILAGGAHHSVLSYDISAQEMQTYADMAGIEFVHIHNNVDLENLEKDLIVSDLVWKLR